MEIGKRALRCFLVSGDSSFNEAKAKDLNNYRFGIDIVHSDDLTELKKIVSDQDIVLLDDDFILTLDKDAIEEFVLFLFASQINAILFTDFSKKLPAVILDRPEIVRIVSNSFNEKELFFHLETIEYRYIQSLLGRKQLQDKYLKTIIQIQNLLLSNSDSEFELTGVLESIGKVSGSGLVTLFENQHDYHGRFLMSQKYEWSEKGVESQQGNPLFNLLPYQPNFSRWEYVLSSGTQICGDISEFPIGEQLLLKSLGFKNLLFIPILIRGDFWGFVMLSCSDRPLWTEDEISLINSAIAPIGSFMETKIEEQKRDKSDERIRRIFESSNIGLVLTNRVGNLKYFNPAFMEMLGYNANELKNLNFRVFTHPDDIDKELPLLENLLDGESSSYLLEKRLVKNAGNSIWVKLNVSAYSRDKGRPESLIWIIENITKEKEVEKALFETEDRYRKLSDLSLEGIVLHQNGITIDCNECFLDILGYSREQFIGKEFAEVFADENSADLTLKKIDKNDPSPFEVIGKMKDGADIFLELENRKVKFDGEQINATAIRDITERKKSELEIKKLNIAINQSPSSIVITNRSGEIEYVNKSFCDITGYSNEEAIGNNPRILKSDYHHESYYKDLWDTLTTGKTWSGIFRNKAKTGAFYWERAVISPIFDDRKNITHFLAIKENITEEKKAQEALKLSEERHRIVSELANDFVYSAFFKKNKLILEWKSGILEKLVGFSIDEINGMQNGWYSVVLTEDLNTTVVPALKRLPKDKVQSFEYRIKTKNGKLKWVLDKVKFIEDESGGETSRIIGAISDITLRKEANLELDQSKRYLDTIIDNLPIGLHIFDEHGYTARINETQRNILGVNTKNVGVGVFNIFEDPLSIATGSDKTYRQVYENKGTINHEIEVDLDSEENRWQTRKGKITLHEIIFPILREDEKVHSVISLSTDITKRVSAEQALKASEEHQKALLKIIPDWIFVLTFDGIFKDVYTEDTSKLLLPEEQFIGKSFTEVFPGEMSKKFFGNLNKAIVTRETQSYRYELNVHNTVSYFETRLLVSKENEVIAIVRDITDNTVAEIALKENEEKFRELAERSQDALVLISIKNEILYVSPNLSNILGISAESYTRNPLDALKLIHPEDKHRIVPELNNYRKGKLEFLDLQFRVMLQDNTQKWVWYRESTVFNEQNQASRFAAVITDITENKIAEEELKFAKEEAEKANKSKSAFLANISHEIRTPMNAVLGFSDLLYSRIQDPVLKGYLNSIKSSGNTLLNLLNDILDLSKIEAEKMSIIASPVNLFSVFDEIKHIFSLKALEKGLDYTFDIDKEIPKSLMLDELRLKQVLLNLVDNAVKFTEKGMFKVKATRINMNSQPGLIDLSILVEDTGIGIPEHMQDTIFESFRQQDDQDKRKYQGTGLGLAITKRLVELFAGKITLESEMHKGSKFEIILNNIEISNPFEVFESEGDKKMRFEDSVLKDKVVVVLDEEKSNRDLIKEVFYLSKSKVIEGENLEEIIADLNGNVDLIIMELNNHKLILRDLEIIKARRNLRKVPKIGINSLVDLDPAFSGEFKSVLTKPIQLPELVEIVESHFNVKDLTPVFRNNNLVEHEDIDKEVLTNIILELEGKHARKWESTLKTSSFSEVEEFAQSMKNMGLEYNLKSLQSFSDVLVMHAKNFDIDNMNNVLKSYPSIISELKNSL